MANRFHNKSRNLSRSFVETHISEETWQGAGINDAVVFQGLMLQVVLTRSRAPESKATAKVKGRLPKPSTGLDIVTCHHLYHIWRASKAADFEFTKSMLLWSKTHASQVATQEADIDATVLFNILMLETGLACYLR